MCLYFSLQATAASSLNKVKTKKIYRGDVTVLEEKPTFYYDRIKESKSESSYLHNTYDISGKLIVEQVVYSSGQSDLEYRYTEVHSQKYSADVTVGVQSAALRRKLLRELIQRRWLLITH